MAKQFEAELVVELNSDLLEGPIWHPDLCELLFADLLIGVVHGWSPKTGQRRVVSKGPVVGGSTIHEDGRVLLFQDGRISLMDPETGKQEQLAENMSGDNERFNDVIADPEGRVFAGTMDGGDGALVRIDLDGSVTRILESQTIPNGLGFSPDLSVLYFTETLSHNIYRYDYNRETGEASDRRIGIQIPVANGFPDGMTVDRDGDVWSAIWHSGEVWRFAPDGTRDAVVVLPVSQPSSVTFGGEAMDELYITTAGSDGADFMGPDPRPMADKPRGGGLYRARIDITAGREEFPSRVRFP